MTCFLPGIQGRAEPPVAAGARFGGRGISLHGRGGGEGRGRSNKGREESNTERHFLWMLFCQFPNGGFLGPFSPQTDVCRLSVWFQTPSDDAQEGFRGR